MGIFAKINGYELKADPFLGEDNRYHYVYKIINLDNLKYYIGIHSTRDLNDGYFGSGSVLKDSIKKRGKDRFKKIILEFYKNREDLVNREEQLITKDVIESDDCYNLVLGGNACDSSGLGLIYGKTISGDIIKVHKDDYRFTNGELRKTKHITKISVFKDGIYEYIYKDELDTYLKDGWIKQGKCKGRISPTKNKMWIHKNGIMKCVPEIYLDELINDGWCRGRLVNTLKDKIGIMKDDESKYIYEYELQQYLDEGWIRGMPSRNKGKITVIDKNNNVFHITKDDPRWANKEVKMICTKNGPSCKGLIYVNKDGVAKRIKPHVIQQYLNEGWTLGNVKKGTYSTIHKDGVIKHIPVEELDNYLNNGWKKGAIDKLKKTTHSKKIYFYDLDGNLVKEFDKISSANAHGFNNINKYAGTNKVYLNKYIIKYEDVIYLYKNNKYKMIPKSQKEDIDMYIENGWIITDKPIRNRIRKIYFYDLDGNLVKEFQSIREAIKQGFDNISTYVDKNKIYKDKYFVKYDKQNDFPTRSPELP